MGKQSCSWMFRPLYLPGKRSWSPVPTRLWGKPIQINWGPGRPEGSPGTDHVTYVLVLLGSIIADRAQVIRQLTVGLSDLV